MMDSEFALALDQAIFGYARLDAGLRVLSRRGPLMDWLPAMGEMATASTVLFGMEAQFEELRASKIARVDLPGLRLAPFDATPFSVSALHDPDKDEYLIFASADCGAHGVERQLAHERRVTRVLEDQALAAGALIREQAALYRDIVETASDLVFRLGSDLRVTFVNSHACRLLGEKEAQIFGRRIDFALRGASPEDSWRYRLAPQADSSFEQALVLPDGEISWIWWRVHWIADKPGGGEYQALGRDITDLRRLRAEAARGAEEARRNAVMRERLRIAHDLHDTLVHSLVALVPQLRLIRKVAGAEAAPRLIDELDRAETAAREGVTLARAALSDLRSKNVEPQGLAAALENLGRRVSERTGAPVEVKVEPSAGDPQLEIAEIFYRIAEEALRNAELHASATRIGIFLSADEDGTHTLVIADDGRGFNPQQRVEGHFGLVGMREQAELIGAHFTLDTEPGAGVRIGVVAPPLGREQSAFG
jgi:PAS domain S-box-containing protein